MGNPQLSFSFNHIEKKVQRLDGNGSMIIRWLKIKSNPLAKVSGKFFLKNSISFNKCLMETRLSIGLSGLL